MTFGDGRFDLSSYVDVTFANNFAFLLPIIPPRLSGHGIASTAAARSRVREKWFRPAGRSALETAKYQIFAKAFSEARLPYEPTYRRWVLFFCIYPVLDSLSLNRNFPKCTTHWIHWTILEYLEMKVDLGQKALRLSNLQTQSDRLLQPMWWFFQDPRNHSFNILWPSPLLPGWFGEIQPNPHPSFVRAWPSCQAISK